MKEVKDYYFKSTTGCAGFIYKLELARDTMLEESNES